MNVQQPGNFVYLHPLIYSAQTPQHIIAALNQIMNCGFPMIVNETMVLLNQRVYDMRKDCLIDSHQIKIINSLFHAINNKHNKHISDIDCSINDEQMINEDNFGKCLNLGLETNNKSLIKNCFNQIFEVTGILLDWKERFNYRKPNTLKVTITNNYIYLSCIEKFSKQFNGEFAKIPWEFKTQVSPQIYSFYEEYGQHIQTLILSKENVLAIINLTKEERDEYFAKIAKHCPNLEIIVFKDFPFKEEDLSFKAQLPKKVKVVIHKKALISETMYTKLCEWAFEGKNVIVCLKRWIEITEKSKVKIELSQLLKYCLKTGQTKNFQKYVDHFQLHGKVYETCLFGHERDELIFQYRDFLYQFIPEDNYAMWTKIDETNIDTQFALSVFYRNQSVFSDCLKFILDETKVSFVNIYSKAVTVKLYVRLSQSADRDRFKAIFSQILPYIPAYLRLIFIDCTSKRQEEYLSFLRDKIATLSIDTPYIASSLDKLMRVCPHVQEIAVGLQTPVELIPKIIQYGSKVGISWPKDENVENTLSCLFHNYPDLHNVLFSKGFCLERGLNNDTLTVVLDGNSIISNAITFIETYRKHITQIKIDDQMNWQDIKLISQSHSYEIRTHLEVIGDNSRTIQLVIDECPKLRIHIDLKRSKIPLILFKKLNSPYQALCPKESDISPSESLYEMFFKGTAIFPKGAKLDMMLFWKVMRIYIYGLGKPQEGESIYETILCNLEFSFQLDEVGLIALINIANHELNSLLVKAMLKNPIFRKKIFALYPPQEQHANIYPCNVKQENGLTIIETCLFKPICDPYGVLKALSGVYEIKNIKVQFLDGVGIDSTGLSKQFISSLGQGLMQVKGKAIQLEQHDNKTFIPVAQKNIHLNDDLLMVTLGKLMAFALNSNGVYLLGELFSPRYFELLLAFEESELLVDFYLLQYMLSDRLIKLYSYIVDDVELRSFIPFQKIRLADRLSDLGKSDREYLNMLGIQVDDIAQVKIELLQYHLPIMRAKIGMARCIAAGLRMSLPLNIGNSICTTWAEVRKASPKDLMLRIQGILTKEKLKEFLCFEVKNQSKTVLTAEILKKWFFAWIDSNSLDRIRNVLLAITGSSAVSMVITVKICDARDVIPHTCFRLLDVPYGISEEQFIAKLNLWGSGVDISQYTIS